MIFHEQKPRKACFRVASGIALGLCLTSFFGCHKANNNLAESTARQVQVQMSERKHTHGFTSSAGFDKVSKFFQSPIGQDWFLIKCFLGGLAVFRIAEYLISIVVPKPKNAYDVITDQRQESYNAFSIMLSNPQAFASMLLSNRCQAANSVSQFVESLQYVHSNISCASDYFEAIIKDLVELLRDFPASVVSQFSYHQNPSEVTDFLDETRRTITTGVSGLVRSPNRLTSAQYFGSPVTSYTPEELVRLFLLDSIRNGEEFSSLMLTQVTDQSTGAKVFKVSNIPGITLVQEHDIFTPVCITFACASDQAAYLSDANSRAVVDNFITH